MSDANSKTTRRPRWVIRVTYPNGDDAYLRRGAKAGHGEIVCFTSRVTAELNCSFVAQGLDAGTIVTVVRWTRELEAR